MIKRAVVFWLLAGTIAALGACTGAGEPARDGGTGDASADASDQAAAVAMLAGKAGWSEALAVVSVPREPGSANWQMVQDYGAQRFSELGYTVERQAFDGGVNVIGVKAGIAPDAGAVVIGAHYDSVPGCPSADDNGSGTAGVIEAARVLSGFSFDKTLVVILFDHEEGDRYTGALGSKAYAARAAERGERIDVVFDFEMIGYKSAEAGSQLIPPGLDLLYPNQVKWIQEHNQAGDFVAVVNDDKCHKIAVDLKAYAKQFSLPSMQLELTEENMHNVLYMTLMRSDHSPFWMKGYPAMMITDTSEYRNLNYHCPNQTVDSINRLDPDFAVAILRSTIAAAVNVLGLR